MTDPLIFDGHNDLLLRLHNRDISSGADGFQGSGGRQIDLVKAREGGFGGGFFAIYVPDTAGIDSVEEMMAESYDLPLPNEIALPDAAPVALSQAASLFQLERDGALKISRSTADIRNCLSSGMMAAVMHMEGAEAIDTDFHMLEVLYQAGLRSLGPVWSRPTPFGHGVPFRFPGSPDTGPGLTADGKRLVQRCNQLGVMIDLSHLNEAGFWDVAKLSDAPLVATHSNAHALTPHTRNLTDRQLHAIRDSDGMVGLNFAVAFLREDGRMDADTPIDRMLHHIDHLITQLGEDRVGFGSDFDGATVPKDIETVAGLPALRAALRHHGINDALMAKLCHDNWLRVLDATWDNP
ncbi:dipeptidase [Phaeobacter gallaeciensis]|uniref:dipeptidase n=1 Tax=Phaeobacter gallaeciensis TaxID=60890 RepID=UPI000BBC4FB5|nr:dipeptidase [Phaeobacter gallaeciensis]ATF18329.1 dipeptidase AC, Metallo peptidase, MEROPS family M19 [Phaeobacter gallaeciensis]ATF22438.1 dipeptidase AC, Metallo peptidase, MEROPS family M19 [Phaeobacter gallaeciensis]